MVVCNTGFLDLRALRSSPHALPAGILKGEQKWWFATQDSLTLVLLAPTLTPSLQVFLRVNTFNQTYEVGCWSAAGDTTCLASSKLPASDYKTWVHLAGVYDGTNWYIYRNGVLAGQNRGRFGSLSVEGAEWAIGSKGGGGDRHFQGSIAFVSLWKAARTQAEISEGMHKERDGDEEGLVGHWPLDDGGGTDVRDAVGDSDGSIQVRSHCLSGRLVSCPL